MKLNRCDSLRLACIFVLLLLIVPPIASAQGGGASGGGAGGGSGSGGQGGQGGAAYPARVEAYADCKMKDPDDDWMPTENRDLSDAYNKNQWRKVEKIISRFFKRITCTSVETQDTVDLDPKLQYYSVLFLDETLPTPTLARVTVHEFAGGWKVLDPKNSRFPEVYGTRIGDYGLFEVRLLPAGVFPISQYMASSSTNALLAQIPGVAAAAAKATFPAAASGAAGGSSTLPVLKNLAFEHFAEIEKLPAPEAVDGLPEVQVNPPAECPQDAQGSPPPTQSKPRTFLVRHVTVPKSFERHFPRIVPSVTPTLAISDQLTFSVGLEAYLLESQDDRAEAFDADIQDRDELLDSDTEPPLQALEQRLFVSYVRCRMPITVEVTSDKAAYLTTEPAIIIARVRYPAASVALTRHLKVHFEIGAVDPQQGVQKVVRTFDRDIPAPGSGGGTSICEPVSLSTAGLYQVTAQVREQEPGTDDLPSVVSANTLFTLSDDPGLLQGKLELKEPSAAATVTWGAALALKVTGSPLDKYRLQILDAASGTKLAEMPPPPLDVNTLIDTSPIGVGDRLAVLLVKDKFGKPVTVARLPFTVTEKTASLASASTPPSGPACLTLDDPKAVDLVSGRQSIAADFTDLFSTFSGLLALAGPSPPSAAQSQSQYTLGRLTKWTFSLGVGGVVSTNFHQPASPLTQPMSWVALDWHPWRYDETRYSPTIKERFRVIYGLSLTPGVGGVIGAGFGLVRGLTLEGGYTLQLANVITGPAPSTCPQQMTDDSDMPAKTPVKCPFPTGRRGLGGWFVGLGYSFQ